MLESQPDNVATRTRVSQLECGRRVEFHILRTWVLAVQTHLGTVDVENLQTDPPGLGDRVVDQVRRLGGVAHRDGVLARLGEHALGEVGR